MPFYPPHFYNEYVLLKLWEICFFLNFIFEVYLCDTLWLIYSFLLTVKAICRFIIGYLSRQICFLKLKTWKQSFPFLAFYQKPSMIRQRERKTHLQNQNLTLKSEIQSLRVHNHQKVTKITTDFLICGYLILENATTTIQYLH